MNFRVSELASDRIIRSVKFAFAAKSENIPEVTSYEEYCCPDALL